MDIWRSFGEVKVCVSPFRIFVDQAGYYPGAKKRAVMNFACERFAVVDEEGRTRYEGDCAHFGFDKNSGDDVYTADFSDFAEEGCFRIVSGEHRSARFEIGDKVYDKVFSDTLKAFYYLRCGCGLEDKYAGVYRHGKCHAAPALLWEDKKTVLEVEGGWHDAGDYGRYVVPGACAAAHLLYAWKLFREAFESRRTGIPENGNVPDILTECRYELEWFLKMQREDGGVYHKATTDHHAAFVMPEDDTDQMYVLPVSSTATADFAAVCALAAGVYEEYDKAFSESLKTAAQRACGWLDENPDFLFENIAECRTGTYGDRDDHSNRFWAYAELYALTGEDGYRLKMERSLEKDFPLTAFGYSEMGGLGALACLLGGRKLDKALLERFENGFHAEAKRLARVADECGYGCAMEEWDYHWGSSMSLMMHGMIFAVSDHLSGTTRFSDYAAAQLHYLLGVNALGYSYVTGNGEFRYNYPHLRPAHADGIEECIPGMVSGGPNRFPVEKDAKELLPEGTPPMKCYIDDVRFFSLNEITIYWNSPAVFVLGYLCKKKEA